MISLAVFVFSIVCMWMIFEKLGIEGWKCLIPFYNTYVLCKRVHKVSTFVVCLVAFFVCMISTLWITLASIGSFLSFAGLNDFFGGISVANILIPVILITASTIVLTVYTIIIYVKLAQAFGKSGAFAVGLVLINPVFLGILAFDSGCVAFKPEPAEPETDPKVVDVQPAEEVVRNQGSDDEAEKAAVTEPVAGYGNKICPYCKAEIKEETKICPYCRSEV